MFSAILKRAGIKGTYVPFKVCPADVGQAIHSIRILNIAGANVTVPYKEAVIPYLDVLSEGARIIGAVNTIVRKGDVLKGYNTNAIGFMDALNHAGFNVAGKSAVVSAWAPSTGPMLPCSPHGIRYPFREYPWAASLRNGF